MHRTQALFAQQPLNTGAIGPGLQRPQRMPVPNNPQMADAVMQWNAQQRPLQAGPYRDGPLAPPQVPFVDARVPQPATLRMQGPQPQGEMEAMVPAIESGFFTQFESAHRPHPLDGKVSPDAMAAMGNSLKREAENKLTRTPIGLPLPPERTDGFSVADQLATKGAPPPGSEAWQAIQPPSSLQALASREQLYAPGMQVKSAGRKR